MSSVKTYRPLRYCVLAFVLFPILASAQPSPAIHRQNLKKLSTEELRACYEDLNVCHADSIYEISDEFIRRIPQVPTDQLLDCFDNWRVCGVSEGRVSGWPVSDELARRGNISLILARYWHEPKWSVRGGIEHVAYHFNTPEAFAFMRKAFAAKMDDGEDLYWPINYLAKHCDSTALKELSTGRFRNQGCMQYQTSVAFFGKCKYRPAIPYLVDSALYDFCGNITDAATEDLQKLFPHSEQKESLEATQQYFCSRAKQENYAVHCDFKEATK